MGGRNIACFCCYESV